MYTEVKKRGSALITALFIMTIITIIVTSMSSKLHLDIHHAKVTINSDKLYLASEAVTFWAIDTLKKHPKPFQSLNETNKILTFPSKARNIYPGLDVNGEVYDLHGLFNLNNLTDKANSAVFFNLIGKVNKKIKKQQRVYIVEATNNWIKGVVYPKSGHDKWLDRYLQQDPKYLPAYQKMQSVSEFRSVYGVTPQIYNSLKPYITALPEETPININTASKELLSSLSAKKKIKLIDPILKIRANQAIDDINKVSKILETADIKANKLTVQSNYFLVVAKVKGQNLSLTSYVTLKTTEDHDKSIRVDIIRQSFNTE